MSHSTVAILGAGPIGLEALIACHQHKIDTMLYEKCDIGSNIRSWGSVRLFSPFELNRSIAGIDLLKQSGNAIAADDELLTGEEYLERYLAPLSKLPALQSSIQTGCEVEKIGKERLIKSELIGSIQRANSRFRLLLNRNGQSDIATADYILDCTGTFGNHNWLGTGGIPCPGEQEFSKFISYELPDIQGEDKYKYLGKVTLVIGSGYSAATNVVAMQSLKGENPDTRIFWLVRNTREIPIQEIPDDSLAERKQLTEQANQLAIKEDSGVELIRGSVVDAIRQQEESGELIVMLSDGKSQELMELRVNQIVANVGFRPDRSIYEELQVHECYATHGPMKLAATLMGETSADCLAQSAHGVSTLKSPEPNFYILGAKSYGRSSRFLIKIGLEQVEEVVGEIAEQLSSS